MLPDGILMTSLSETLVRSHEKRPFSGGNGRSQDERLVDRPKDKVKLFRKYLDEILALSVSFLLVL